MQKFILIVIGSIILLGAGFFVVQKLMPPQPPSAISPPSASQPSAPLETEKIVDIVPGQVQDGQISSEAPAKVSSKAGLPSSSPTLFDGKLTGLLVMDGIPGVSDMPTLMTTRAVQDRVPQVAIFTLRPDGSGKKFLTGLGNAAPSWTPDGKIIFVSDRSGSPQIWIMDADGANPKQVSRLPNDVPLPHQPQQGRNGLIVFQMGSGIWTMRKDGSNLQRLVDGGAAPGLALSGLWFSFTAKSPGTDHNEIWRINTDGSGRAQLTFPGDADYPDGNASIPSPDEKLIAFYSGLESLSGKAGLTQDISTFGHRDVAVIPSNGGARRRLTNCKPVASAEEAKALPSDACIAGDSPAWSPDGQWVLYDRGVKTGGETWVIDINGRNDQRITRYTRGEGKAPWQAQ